MLSLGADPTGFLESGEEDLLIWIKILRKAEEVYEVRRENDLQSMMTGTTMSAMREIST